MKDILKIEDLHVNFYTKEGVGKAVNGLSMNIKQSEVMGVVGESGSGKTVTAMAILGLVSSPGKIESGKIIFGGEDLIQKSENELRKIRGNDISMIFQEPMTSLNPVLTVGDQIIESILLHQKISKEEAIDKAVKIMELVGISMARERIDHYPHQFSGGMRQRVMIAMALACNPDLLIADEPTTALDVTIQAQILDLILDIKGKIGKTSIMLITHDLAVVAETCDKVTVIYCGEVVEAGDVHDIFKKPLHPYTQGLLKSLPRIDDNVKESLYTIPGIVPSIYEIPEGCKFSNRCELADEKCKTVEPEIRSFDNGHLVRCYKA